MRRFAGLLVAATVIALAAPLAAGAVNSSTVGRWSIVTRGDDASRVQLRLEYSASTDGGFSNSSWSSPVPLAEAGIGAERLRGPIGTVSFQIAREPGTFSCSGSAGEGSGAGQFTYAPNPRFDDALAARGFGRPSYQQSLELAISGATLAFADQVRASAAHASVAELLRVTQHGVNPRYIADLAALGYKPGSLDQLIALRDHGVTSRFVGDLAAAGYKNLSVDELVALRDHGVSVAFVDRLKAHGYTNLSVRDLIRLRDSGI